MAIQGARKSALLDQTAVANSCTLGHVMFLSAFDFLRLLLIDDEGARERQTAENVGNVSAFWYFMAS